MKIENVGPRGSGIFALSVTDKDPQLAFRIVESYLKNLQDLNNQINVGTVLNLLKFVENKLNQSKEDLSKAQGELREFKMKYGIAELKSQSEVIIHRIGELQMELAKTESNLSVLERQFTKNDPEVIRTRVKVAELKERIRQLQGGGTVSINPDHSERGKQLELATIKEIPELTMKLGELEQKVQIQNDIYKLLMVQYESAKIEATKEARIIQVIDKPGVPEDPEPRKAKQNTMIAGVVGFMLTIMGSFFIEYVNKNKGQLFPSKTTETI
jgi:capsule polysaccharide export protein KpsE/RkpR